MDRQALVRAVESTVPLAEMAHADFYANFPWLVHGPLTVYRWPPSATQIVAAVIAQQQELVIFHNHAQYFPGGAQSTTHEDLSKWLMERARQVGADAAVGDLERYLASRDIPYYSVAALAGVKISAESRFANDIALVPFEAVPDSLQKRIYGPRPFDHSPLRPVPSAALLRRTTYPRRHDATLAGGAMIGGLGIPEDLYEAALLLTLAGPSAVAIVGAWFTPEPWVPLGHICSGSAHSNALSVIDQFAERILTAEEIEHAIRLHRLYSGLQSTTRNRLAVPLRRFNQALRRSDAIDAAVDLAVSLETLLLGDRTERGEIGFTLRIRAARFLGLDVEDRRNIDRQVRGLYGIRSAGAHSGAAPASVEAQPTGEFLRGAYRLAARAIERAIENGLPGDWMDVVLG